MCNKINNAIKILRATHTESTSEERKSEREISDSVDTENADIILTEWNFCRYEMNVNVGIYTYSHMRCSGISSSPANHLFMAL
jgi:hypothetical protein